MEALQGLSVRAGSRRAKPFVRVIAILFAFVAFTGCADTEPPRWPPRAVLSAIPDGDTVRLSWPEATDDTTVAAYRVSRGRTRLGETTTRSFSARGETRAGASTTFEIVPIDQAGHEGRPLRAEVLRRRAPATVAEVDAPSAPSSDSTDSTDTVDSDGAREEASEIAPPPNEVTRPQRLMEFIPGVSQSGRPPIVEAERARRGLARRQRIADRVSR